MPSNGLSHASATRQEVSLTAFNVPLRVQGPHGWTLQALASLLQAMVPALLMNICIVGLNQIFDVPIDRINKPYLPLASGEFTMRMGQSVVCLDAFHAFSSCTAGLATSNAAEVTNALNLVLSVTEWTERNGSA